jgi:hypothetical protein
MQSIESQLTFQRNVSPPSLGLKNKPAFMLVSCSAYSSTLKMEAICSSEMSVAFQQATWHYILEDRTLQQKICVNNVRLS